MIDQAARRGVEHALVRFKVSAALPGAMAGKLDGMFSRMGNFGIGQVGAAQDLYKNLRGGLGGRMNPDLITGAVPAHSTNLARATHRQEALGNLNQLAPSLAAGGLYAWHRHNKSQDEDVRRRAMMAQQGYAPSM